MSGDWTVFGDRMEPYAYDLTTGEAYELLRDLEATHDGSTEFYAENARTNELIYSTRGHDVRSTP